RRIQEMAEGVLEVEVDLAGGQVLRAVSRAAHVDGARFGHRAQRQFLLTRVDGRPSGARRSTDAQERCRGTLARETEIKQRGERYCPRLPAGTREQTLHVGASEVVEGLARAAERIGRPTSTGRPRRREQA